MRAATLTGLGSHRPQGRRGNAVIAARIGSTDEWIRERSGIVERGVAEPGDDVVTMACDAGGKALADAGVTPDDVGLVLLATCSMPGPLPGGAPEVAARLRCAGAGAADVGAGCAGFTYALGFAADAVRSGSAEHVLVVGSELLTPMLDLDDRSTAFLFGDGAGAVVVSAAGAAAATSDTAAGIGPPVWAHAGDQASRLVIGPDRRLSMEGQAVFRWATATLPALARRACDRAGVRLEELAAFVPHQANLRITDAVVRALRLPASVAVARDIVTSGNTSAASVPLALDALRAAGAVHPGDPVLLLGFGAGLTAAGQVVRCP